MIRICLQFEEYIMTKKRSGKIIEMLKIFYGNMDMDAELSDNIYELTVKVVLSAQTTDRQVNSVASKLFWKFPDFYSLSKAPLSEVENTIKSVGLYRNKARSIVNLSRRVIDKHNGFLPDTFEELVKLPGIGRKSANVILSLGFKKAAFAVDTHIQRIANRLGYKKSNNPYEIEKALASYIPREDWRRAHLLLIEHGRSICKARKPLCNECPVNNLCDGADNIP